MLIRSNSLAQQLRLMMLRCLPSAALALMLAGALSPVSAQTPTPTPFSSGSTGTDGAFAPTQRQTIQVPESGVFNFTTVTIPTGVIINFKPNSRNTPVTILAQGDVRIAGYFGVSGFNGGRNYGGLGGPGGFRGGDGGVWLNDPAGKAGDGPGGGGGGPAVANGSDANGGGGGGYFSQGGSAIPNLAPGGPAYGTKVLLPLIGGSGGGGGSAALNGSGGAGGGGGGAILIASSTKIIFESGDPNVGIYAIGGNAGCATSSCGGGGSGGAIRLVANTITGAPLIWAYGGTGSNDPRNFGGNGYIRVEAFDLSQFQINSRGVDNFSFGRPNPVMLANNPGLRIVSVGGVNAPAQPVGSFYTAQPDLVVSESVTNPVNVVIQATNIPGTPTIQVTRITEAGERATDTCTLSNNTCTTRVSLPLSKTSLIIATTTVDGLLAFGRPIFIDGERVNKVEIAAAFGGQSEVTYITDSGRRLKWPQ